MANKPKIFTFWEPKKNIPAYIQLCLKTWEKFLPEYEIVVLDYSNLDKYLGKNFYDEILYKDFRFYILSDAIRVALLKLYGGIWLDADTIITSPEVKKFFNISSHELVFIGEHLAFIKADKKSSILNCWLEKIHYNLKFYKNQKYFPNKFSSKIEKLFHFKLFRIMNKWNYFGNSIINKYIKDNIIIRILKKLNLNFPTLYNYYKKKKKVLSIDRIKSNALPELLWKPEIDIKEKNNKEFYRQFYFENDFSEEVMKNTKGIILLHNHYCPKIYQEMSKEEFLNQNNTLANVLKTILSD